VFVQWIETHADHRHGIQLPQGSHGFEQQDDKAASFHGFDRTSEKVWSDRLEVLQDTHSIGVTENLMALLVIPIQKSAAAKGTCSRICVRVSDIRHGNENFERVLFVWFAYASLDLALNFCFSLLTVTVIRGNVLYQLDEVRGDKGEPAHLLKPSSFL
jgi:hypothetical protein